MGKNKEQNGVSTCTIGYTRGQKGVNTNSKTVISLWMKILENEWYHRKQHAFHVE